LRDSNRREQNALVHVHLENYTSKHRVFWLTPQHARSSQRSVKGVRFTHSDDFQAFEKHLRTASVLVTSSDVIRDARFPRGDALRAAAPELKLVHIIGAGIEGILPLDWLPRGVRLTNNSGVHVAKAREFALMALLALNARLPTIVTNQRAARWEPLFTPLIRGKTLAVLGLGDMGRAAVAAGRNLGLTIVGVRRASGRVPGVARVFRTKDLQKALKGADFLVIAAPLTPETKGLVDEAALRALKPGAGVINFGRAGILDHEALTTLLRGGHVGGAILDVLPQEPLPSDSALWATPNLVVFPHVSSDDADGYMRDTMALVCRNVDRLRKGRAISNVVDPKTGY
jgi:phosphoglycerate dehydrogenase-like enzyme